MITALLICALSAAPAPTHRVHVVHTAAELAHTLAVRDELRHAGARIVAAGFTGRLVRCAPGGTCDRWDPHPERKVVFFFGPDGFDLLISKGSDREFLLALGYPRDFLDTQVRAGTRFELVGFPTPRDLTAPATWGRLRWVVNRAHGPAVGRRVAAVLDRLPRTQPSGARVDEAALVATPLERVTPQQVRDFLATVDDVNALFTGVGVTRGPDGSSGLTERVGPNGPIPTASVRVTLTP